MLRLIIGKLILGMSIGSAIAAGTSPLSDGRNEYIVCVVAAVDDMVAAYPTRPTDEVIDYATAECIGITGTEDMMALDPVFRTELEKINRNLPADDNFIEPETEEAASTPAVQPSQEAQGRVSASAPTPLPIPAKAAKTQYNPAKLTIQTNVPACRWMSDHDKWINLISAGRRDLAARLDCVEIPEGEHVILMDEVNSMRQVYWEHDGTEFQGWLLEDYALDDFDMEAKKSCDRSDSKEYFNCLDKLLGQFERINN